MSEDAEKVRERMERERGQDRDDAERDGVPDE